MGLNVPCQAACPAGTNIPAYIRSLFEEKYDQSYEINQRVNILPGVLGRICSRPCEDKCRHGEAELGKPVNICHIKRTAADYKHREHLLTGPLLSVNNQKVAVIGGGPAGLAAAHDLALIGFPVTLFEALEEPGGMLRYGIPAFRLPRHILKQEIDQILSLGIDLKTHVRIGSDVTIAELLSDYAAVLLSTGCFEALRLNIPGENLPGVHHGLDFMMDVCSDRSVSLDRRVLVIGAGFTAFDCARSALRLGAENVSICLRRTEEDLVVTEDEILETKKEGIKIESLLLSRRILGQERVEGVEFVRTRPGEIRADNKREITPIEGSEFILETDAVIVATGQAQVAIPGPGEKNQKGVLTADPETLMTSQSNLYLAGDYLTGPSTVIEAIAMGRRAAEQIARNLTGRQFRETIVTMEEAQITDRQRAWDFIPRQEMPTIEPVENRYREKDIEVETGFSKETGHEESKRCYLCYLHYEIDLNRCIYCRYCIDVAPRDCIKLVDEIITNEEGAITGFKETTTWQDINAIVIDNSRCIRCGECVRVCPVECISVTRVQLNERLLQTG
jgi:formate dehydrogenase major subunit